MSSTQNTIVAFDLYGTLLSTESIAKQLASHVGEEQAAAIAAIWRMYQLEYTWRLNSMGKPSLVISQPDPNSLRVRIQANMNPSRQSHFVLCSMC
jgi:FMN phosphatase YigB (HAD superfamily)